MHRSRSYPGHAPFTPEEKSRRIAHHTHISDYFGLLGLRLVDLKSGCARMQLPFRPEKTHSGGTVQGG